MDQRYVGIHDDKFGGMTHLGLIVKDGWLFGLIPENETCAGWLPAQMQILYDRVSSAWAPYGHLPSRLPPELREKHGRIYREAMERARALGWNPEMDDDE
jgi:hypothetical protein